MKIYNCIVDDGENVFREICTAKSKRDLLNVYGGNGKFEKIVDVTKDYLNENSVIKLRQDLSVCGWGDVEKKVICDLLEDFILNRK